MFEVPLNSHTKKFWESVHTFSRKYRFWCITDGASPRPELIPPKQGDRSTPFGHFCRVPYVDVRSYAFWGFDTAQGRAAFLVAYGGDEWRTFK